MRMRTESKGSIRSVGVLNSMLGWDMWGRNARPWYWLGFLGSPGRYNGNKYRRELCRYI